MKNVMGIINLAEDEQYIKELTEHRALAAVPFAGRYRLIDFALSNLVNAGIRNVAILTQHKYRSIVDHVGSGKEWDLDRKRDGLFLLPPAYTSAGSTLYRGDVENFYSNLDYIQMSTQSHVIISGSAVLSNMDYRKALAFHEDKGADITVVYTTNPVSSSNCTLLQLNEERRVIDAEVNPRGHQGNNVSMKTYIMKKSLLMDLVDGAMTRGGWDLVKDGFIRNLDLLKIYAYRFEGYVAIVNTIQSYFAHSMELLDPRVWKELFFSSGFVYTKVKNEAPAKHRAGAHVTNSMVANGCVIEGTVENSILFRGVRVKEGAVVRNSIVMQKANIGKGVVLENAILDKDVVVSEGKKLRGERNYPVIVRKQAVI